ncbi:MAG: hypothetical protein IIU59_03110 [Alistipes sp.]|nr:hypothetical protein [Alistipes sp.]
MRRVINLFLIVVCLFSLTNLLAANPKTTEEGYVIVKVKADGKRDVSDAIQKIIDENPNRTIYFPDGVYLISKPILTPAEPTKSVALELSNYAIIKAAEGWSHDEAMIRLGGKDAANNIRTPGSNYYLEGGIIDGSGVAKGISIDSGRETVIRNTSIKSVIVGIHIKHGANSGSSDSDIFGVNIVGNNTPESVGVLVEGYDNTFTNMRIGGVHFGFKIRSQANMLRNIHPLYYGSNNSYETSCGFLDEAGCNWYDFCYSDEFATAFRITKSASHYNNCFAYWYSKRGIKHTIFKSDGEFNSAVMNMHAGHRQHNATTENKILEVGKDGGKGHFAYLHIDDESVVTDRTHEKYIK